MVDINGLAVTKRVNADPSDISICCSIHRHILFLIGTDIKSHMPMACAQLTKIGDDGWLIRRWPAKIIPRINERLGAELSGAKNDENDDRRARPHHQMYKASTAFA
jgi:hypothetical protein